MHFIYSQDVLALCRDCPFKMDNNISYVQGPKTISVQVTKPSSGCGNYDRGKDRNLVMSGGGGQGGWLIIFWTFTLVIALHSLFQTCFFLNLTLLGFRGCRQMMSYCRQGHENRRQFSTDKQHSSLWRICCLFVLRWLFCDC